MSTENSGRIFISYGHDEFSGFALSLADFLRGHEYEVFIDKDGTYWSRMGDELRGRFEMGQERLQRRDLYSAHNSLLCPTSQWLLPKRNALCLGFRVEDGSRDVENCHTASFHISHTVSGFNVNRKRH